MGVGIGFWGRGRVRFLNGGWGRVSRRGRNQILQSGLCQVSEWGVGLSFEMEVRVGFWDGGRGWVTGWGSMLGFGSGSGSGFGTGAKVGF